MCPVKKKTILFVGNTSWSMWNFRREVMESIQNSGFRVGVAAPRDQYTKHLEDNFEYLELKKLGRKSKSPIADLVFFVELYKLFSKLKPDLVILYTIKPNIYGNLAARFLSLKTVSVIPGAGCIFSRSGLLNKMAVFLYRLTLPHTSKVIFLNTEDREEFKELRILRGNAALSEVFPGEGVDTKHYLPFESKVFLGEGCGRFFFIGRMLKEKGIVEFLAASSEIKKQKPNVEFHVVGPLDSDDPMSIDLNTLDPYIENGSITYHGEMTDIRPMLQEADALVLPTRYREGLSRICLESLSLGVPVISTRNRGCTPVVIPSKTGLLLSEPNEKSLVDSLFTFLELSADCRKSLGQNGRRLIVAKYSMSTIVDKYQKLIKKILGRPDRLAS